jgi:hypothetical protein
MSDSGDGFRFLFATITADALLEAITDDGPRLPAMRDQRLVGQADDQQAGLTVASRYQ